MNSHSVQTSTRRLSKSAIPAGRNADVAVPIDPANGLLASAGQTTAKSEVFITGTQPTGVSGGLGGGGTQVASWDAPAETPAATGGVQTSDSRVRSRRPVVAQEVPRGEQRPAPVPPASDEKKGVFGRIGDWFKRRNAN